MEYGELNKHDNPYYKVGEIVDYLFHRGQETYSERGIIKGIKKGIRKSSTRANYCYAIKKEIWLGGKHISFDSGWAIKEEDSIVDSHGDYDSYKKLLRSKDQY